MIYSKILVQIIYKKRNQKYSLKRGRKSRRRNLLKKQRTKQLSLDEQKKKEVKNQKRDVQYTDVKFDEIKIELPNNGQCTEENHSEQSLDSDVLINEK